MWRALPAVLVVLAAAGAGLDRPYASASVTKAMLLAAYLRQPSVRSRALRPADRNLLTPMIRWSSNKVASRVNRLLGPDHAYATETSRGVFGRLPAPLRRR